MFLGMTGGELGLTGFIFALIYSAGLLTRIGRAIGRAVGGPRGGSDLPGPRDPS